MRPIAVTLIAFAVILAGALLGALLRRILPQHHLADDSRDYVRLGTGLIATLAALVLGLLIGSANVSYDTESSQVRHLTVNIVLLDKLLEQYGPEARGAREALRHAVEPMVERIWREDSAESGTNNLAPRWQDRRCGNTSNRGRRRTDDLWTNKQRRKSGTIFQYYGRQPEHRQ